MYGSSARVCARRIRTRTFSRFTRKYIDFADVFERVSVRVFPDGVIDQRWHQRVRQTERRVIFLKNAPFLKRSDSNEQTNKKHGNNVRSKCWRTIAGLRRYNPPSVVYTYTYISTARYI